ncbi:MAG: aminopeptidase N [Myxococcales bacterium]|nr:aminopeptidase N [Myxococcales bacterium]
MKDAPSPQAIALSDYKPVIWAAESVELRFELHEDHARVTQVTQYAPNPHHDGELGPLLLDGIDLTTESVRIDHDDVDYAIEDHDGDGKRLSLQPPPRSFSLEIVTRIAPQANTTMEGLYRSGAMFCTQMEAEGFRRVTWYQDRPDVLAIWTVTIEADADKYPVSLSNGNLIEERDLGRDALGRNRKLTRWHDPFAKPSYLFALVAGDLDVTDDTFTTQSGREVTLRVFVDKGNADQSHHAMDSLKKSMRWDEEVYGREYDLDIFHIVAVHDFNMGAMENKSLNLFNAAAVLAKADTATDDRFSRIEGVVAHEYFHNWTGNRITCRDWFQLSLKEGLTVFRDQEFSADMNHRGVERIGAVRHLRATQFIEDAGPMAHPVRPASYIEINNFYTTTIYEKGAEVIRMMHTLLGADGFRKGTDLYFERHDGQAVTCDDFLAAMRDGAGHDLAQFERWYSQAGTPHVHATWQYNETEQTLKLSLAQTLAPTPGQATKLPVHIPVRMALIGPDGAHLPLQQDNGSTASVLSFTEAEQSWTFVGVHSQPVPSLLRGFSAPVKLTSDLSAEDLRHLARHDDDAFNRWESIQLLAGREVLRLTADAAAGRPLETNPVFVETMAAILADERVDPAFIAIAARLPSESILATEMDVVNVEAIHVAREHTRKQLGLRLHDAWLAHWQHEGQATSDRAYAFNATDAGHRALKNIALGYLCAAGQTERALEQMIAADNMTDELSALSLLADAECPEREPALARFLERWNGDALVMNNWFAVQAGSSRDATAADVRALASHASFDDGNPNKIRALYGAFANNQRHFHAADGSGYLLLSERIIAVDKGNPILAGRLARFFNAWRRQDEVRQGRCEVELRRILATEGLSRNTFEIVSKTLG